MNRTRIMLLGLALVGAALSVAAVLGFYSHAQRPAGPAAMAAAIIDPAQMAVASGDVRVDYERHLARHPRDGRAWVLLARVEFADNRFDEAVSAYAKALEVARNVARDPGVWCEYADALAMMQGGVLAGKPRELIARALELDATHAMALEMSGSAAYEAREFVAAARFWRQLLGLLDDASPQHGELTAAIARAERLALAAHEPGGW